jgi:hypothetical protein
MVRDLGTGADPLCTLPDSPHLGLDGRGGAEGLLLREEP